MIDRAIIDQLKEEGEFSEVHQVVGCYLFDCIRNHKRFRVEITDSGDEDNNFRFHVHVINPNGTRNTMSKGNGGKTIAYAISDVHWSNLEMCDDFKR